VIRPHLLCSKLCFLLGGALLLVGCTTLGPDFEEPDVTWLEAWETDLYGLSGDGEPDPGFDLGSWWQLFDDPALNQLIEAARTSNPTLRIAGLRVLESRAVLGIARSGRYPQVNQLSGGANAVSSREIGSGQGGSDSLVDYQLGFGLGWELDFWGRFQRGIESADAAFFASIVSHRDVQVLLTAQVADLYFAYLTTRARIAIAGRNAGIQQRSYEITEELYRSGQSSELDLQQARTQYLSTRSEIPALEITLTNLRNALAALLGRPPGALPELASAPEDLPQTQPALVRELPARLLMRRPDVRTAAWQVAAQSAQIGIARADYFPAISLVGTIGVSGNSLSASPDTGLVSVGPGFTWNIFDYGRIGNNVRVQDARLEQAIANFQNRVLDAAREIDDTAVSIAKTEERKQYLSASVDAALRSLELANTRYREGYADFQRVLDAQRVLFLQAEQELVNRSSHISAIVNFYKALGGGWRATPVEELIEEPVRERMRSRSNWGDLLDAPLPEPALPGPG
jgi:NodT family efflux transporter outer membrane factor (OMF) lipoprotein